MLAISEKYKLEMTLGDTIQTTENSQTLKASAQTKGSFEVRQQITIPRCNWVIEGNADIDDRDVSEISITETDPAKGIYRLEIKPPKDKVIPLDIVYKGKCPNAPDPSGTYDQPLKYPLPETVFEVKIAPGNPDRIVGTKTYEKTLQFNGKLKEVVTWDLQRK